MRGIYADRYIGELLDENGKLRADAEEYLTEEMAADLVGYTLSDPAILESLTGQQRTVMQKFVDKLVSMFGDKNEKTAKEYLSNADADIRAIFKDVAKEADVIAEQFRAALDTSKKAEKNTVERDGVRSSKDITLGDIKTLQSIAQNGRKSINDFTSSDIKASEKFAKKFWKELGTKSPFFRAWFGDWRANQVKQPSYVTDIPQGVNIDYTNRLQKNEDTGWDVHITRDLIKDSQAYSQKDRLYIDRLLSNIDEVINKAVLLDTEITDVNNNNKKCSSQFMHKMYSIVEYQGAPFLAKITVEEYEVNKKRAYNAQRIKMSALSRAQYNQLKTAYRGNYASNADAISIADLFDLVKTYDKSFNPKPSSVVVDENSMPKIVYHGTNVDFDIKKSPQKNKFWVHRINVKENAEVKSSGADALKRRPNLDVDNSISKDNGNVNTSNERNSKELFTDDRTMSAEEIENDEIEQMVQSIISSDDLSDADVKAIREEIKNITYINYKY